MSRPRKAGLDYFPHDTDASNDEKVEALQSLYKNDGYAFYFKLLERIYRTTEGQLDVSDVEIKQVLCNKLLITIEQFDKMMNTAIKIGCFDKNLYEIKGIITSNGIQKRRKSVVDKRLKMREEYENKNIKDSKNNKLDEVIDEVSDDTTYTYTLNNTLNKEGIVKRGKENKWEKECYEVITYLNQQAGTAFRDGSSSTIKHIRARLSEGFTVDQLKSVIEKKVQQWKSNPDMSKYLRPATLFNSEKFEAYLNEPVDQKKEGIL